MRRFARIFAAGFISAFSLVTQARSEELRIWPAPFENLWGLERTQCSKNSSQEHGPENSAKIHPELCPVFNDGPLVENLVRQFNAQIKAKLPHVVGDLNEGLPAGVPLSQALRETLVASLHISRADLWAINKISSQDIFLPYTLTLNLTNAGSGEVVFTVSHSVVPQGTFTLRNGIAEARGQLEKSLLNGVGALVDKAALAYKPYPIPATVRDKVGERVFVLDKGRLAGFRQGDRVGTDAVVSFADANYSVINAGLFPLAPGQIIEKSATAPADVLARPSVFVVVSEQPKGMSANYLRIIFEQQLGQGKALTVMPGNESFSQIRRLMVERAHAPNIDLFDRPLPDFVLRIRVYTLPSTHFETNLPGVRMHTFEAYALAELLDRSGRVVYAANIKNRIDDQVAADVAFSEQSREDTVISNALQQLADKMSSEFKPQTLRVPIAVRGEGYSLDDPGGSVPPGATGVALRKKGRVNGIAGEVWFPVGTYTVDGSLTLRATGLEVAKLKPNDAFSFDSGAPQAQSRISYSRCADAVLPAVDVNGDLLLALAENRFVSSFPAPTYLNGFGETLGRMMDEFAPKKKEEMGAIARLGTDRCFRSTIRITRGGDVISKNSTVIPTASIIVGYTLNDGPNKLAASGKQVELKASGIPINADKIEREASFVRDAAVTVNELSGLVSKSIKVTP